MSPRGREQPPSPGDAPPVDTVRAVLRGLVAGTTTPFEAEDWAMPWVAAWDPPEMDRVRWRALTTLSGAGMLVAPDELLFGPDDFAAWLRDFEDGLELHGVLEDHAERA